MTVSSTSSRVVLAGDGTNTDWPFGFQVNSQADLAVTYVDASGNETALSPSVYSVSGFGQPAGGTVRYPLSGSPIGAGTTLAIQRTIAPIQPTSISNQGAMWPQVIEAALDRVTMIVQGFIDTVSRCVAITPADGAALHPLPAVPLRANMWLAFDGSGQPVAAQAVGQAGVASWLANNFLLAGTSAAAARSALGAIALADVGAGATIAATGTYTLPGGLILKWGTSGAIASAGNAVQTFPAAFPNAFFGALLTPLAASAGYADSGGTASVKIHNSGAGSATYFWLALGN
jgi:hypothetical protein